MFTLVGLLEFFYKEAPAGMRSLSTSFTFLSLSFGYFLSTVFVDVINAVTKKITPSKQGWLHGKDINKNNINLFYWFLAILSVLNFVIYVWSALWYKYKEETIYNVDAHQQPIGGAPRALINDHDDAAKEEKAEESDANKNNAANDDEVKLQADL